MAILKQLLVNGPARFLSTIYANDLNVGGGLAITGTINLAAGTSTSASLQINNKGTLYGYDNWLRINEQKQFTSGVYFGTNIVRTDGSFQIGNAGANINLTTSAATFKVPINVNGTTYYWNTSGSINANAGTFVSLNSPKGVFTNMIVTDTLVATHQEIEHVANLGGVFLVTPTVKCISSGSGKTLTSLTVTAANTTRTDSNGESVTYNYTLAINDSAFSTATIGGNTWGQYGEVKVSGNINGVVLGTCKGFIQSINTTSHVLTVAIKYTGVQTPATPSDISTVVDLNVMLTTIYDSGNSRHNPVGIWMRSRDTNGYSHISLYGGTDVNPTVRIGNLANLPDVNGVTPEGWGIYTDHGYFNGVIVSESGKIGGWTIGQTAIYTGTVTSNNTNSVAISSADFTRTIDNTSRQNLRIGVGSKFGLTGEGVLYASGAVISGNITATEGTIGGCSITNGVLQVASANVSNISIGQSQVSGLSTALGNKADSSTVTAVSNTATNAAKTATNFIVADSSGLMVADMSNGAATSSTVTARNVFIDSDSVDIRDGQDVLASFGEVTTVGDASGRHIEIDETGFYTKLNETSKLIFIGVINDPENNNYAEILERQKVTNITASDENFIGFTLNSSCVQLLDVKYENTSILNLVTLFENYDSIVKFTSSGSTYLDEYVMVRYYTNELVPCLRFGLNNTSKSKYSVVFGTMNEVYASYALATGYECKIQGEYSVAEGWGSSAIGDASHAEGYNTEARGAFSHAQNESTKANGDCQTAIGKYNVADNNGVYALIIGNGTSNSNRSNALAVKWDGTLVGPMVSYKVNDTFSITQYNLNGIISTASKDIILSLETEKDMSEITTVSVTALTGALRGVKGVIDSTTYSTNWLTGNVYTVTATKKSRRHVEVRIVRQNGTAFSNTTNETPVSLYATITLKFT